MKIFLFSAFAGTLLHASVVLQVGRDGRFIQVSQDAGNPWRQDENLCIYKKEKKINCGSVAKADEKSAVVRLLRPTKLIAKGDSVRLSDPSSRNPRESVSIGILAGANLGSISLKDSTSMTLGGATSYAAGAAIDFPLSESFSFEADLMYSKKNSTISGLIGSDPYTSTLSYAYLELPLLLKAKFNFGVIRPFFVLGPYVSFLMSGTQTFQFSGTTSTTDLKSVTNSLDYGLTFGVGFDIKVSDSVYITATGRYGLGIADIDATNETPANLRVIQALAGLRFSL